MNNTTVPRDPGLYEIASGHVHQDDEGGWRTVTNVRRLAERESKPGAMLIAAATWLLAAAAAVLFTVSIDAQFRYVLTEKHTTVIAALEALGPDVLMAIFSLLALGLAKAGQPARIERVLILVCALVSAVMNYAAADVTSPRSILVYVLPPVLLAVAVDRVVAVVRRHSLGEDDHAAWMMLGTVVLYAIRFVLAMPSTATGLRRWVLVATPLPGLPAATEPEVIDPPPTKKAALLALYRAHPDYGDRSAASRVAKELAAQAGLQWGTARTYLADELTRNEEAG